MYLTVFVRFCGYFSHPSGLLGILQTDKNYRGQGYAKLVTKYIQKEVAKMGDDIYGDIDEDNVASRSLNEKIGSKVVDTISYIICKHN